MPLRRSSCERARRREEQEQPRRHRPESVSSYSRICIHGFMRSRQQSVNSNLRSRQDALRPVPWRHTVGGQSGGAVLPDFIDHSTKTYKQSQTREGQHHRRMTLGHCRNCALRPKTFRQTRGESGDGRHLVRFWLLRLLQSARFLLAADFGGSGAPIRKRNPPRASFTQSSHSSGPRRPSPAAPQTLRGLTKPRAGGSFFVPRETRTYTDANLT